MLPTSLTVETRSPSPDSPRTDPDLLARFEHLKSVAARQPNPSYEQRIDWLERLASMLQTQRTRIAETVAADFGVRSVHETQLAEVFTVVSSIRYVQGNLRRWMRPERRRVRVTALPGRARVHYQPLGVVGVIAPWNYPFQLAIAPLVPALSAGNRVLLKPSERTPRTGALLQELLASTLGDDVCSVVLGDVEVSREFCRLPLDHLLFTGSPAAGREVMRAAAENLTPVTLELGGKCPALVHPEYPMARAVARVAAGKWFNAGQTCVAPDYLLVPRPQLGACVEELERRTKALYPTLRDNPDYTAIIDERHYRRLEALIEDAERRGARALRIAPAGESFEAAQHKLPPTLILDVHDAMAVMREEIFGPILPIIGYDDLDEALEYIQRRKRPLALYYFDNNSRRVRYVLERTVTGGATINDTLMHCAIEDLPFGGVGGSGMGAYHAFEGFKTFSHAKGVFYQSRFNGASSMDPPFTPKTNRLLNYLIGR